MITKYVCTLTTHNLEDIDVMHGYWMTINSHTVSGHSPRSLSVASVDGTAEATGTVGWSIVFVTVDAMRNLRRRNGCKTDPLCDPRLKVRPWRLLLDTEIHPYSCEPL